MRGNLTAHAPFARAARAQRRRRQHPDLLARLYGCNPRNLLQASSMQEQRAIFNRELAPIFDKRFVRWLFTQPIISWCRAQRTSKPRCSSVS